MKKVILLLCSIFTLISIFLKADFLSNKFDSIYDFLPQNILFHYLALLVFAYFFISWSVKLLLGKALLSKHDR